MRPSRSRTYSTESDLGGEFVSDFQTPSAVGAPGQQVFIQRREQLLSKFGTWEIQKLWLAK